MKLRLLLFLACCQTGFLNETGIYISVHTRLKGER